MASSIVDKAQAAAAAAKLEVKRIKGLLKQARRVSKGAKQLVKDARRKAKAETAADAKAKSSLRGTSKGTPKGSPTGTRKDPLAKSTPVSSAPATSTAARAGTVPKVPAITVRKARAPRLKSTQTLRSAAEVAKSVIERLQSPPPVLPPEPNLPPAGAVLPDSGTGGPGHETGEKATEH